MTNIMSGWLSCNKSPTGRVEARIELNHLWLSHVSHDESSWVSQRSSHRSSHESRRFMSLFESLTDLFTCRVTSQVELLNGGVQVESRVETICESIKLSHSHVESRVESINFTIWSSWVNASKRVGSSIELEFASKFGQVQLRHCVIVHYVCIAYCDISNQIHRKLFTLVI